uniref:keratin-associated protein 5-10-like n=1 Tax=Podarcis muralis TaxID=64176 RepID=UPI00109F3247|nr:keratin-associated protein 5-10-like [Podarcis muralis]
MKGTSRTGPHQPSTVWMCEEGCNDRVIYSSGREPWFNLNSTWYGPAGSWLDNRRKPFRYVVNTACVTGCNRRDDVPRRGGHNYRCYGYRRSTCRQGGNPRVTCCVHNPSGGPRDYWGRPIGDSCDGNTGGHYSNEESFCCGSGGGCGGGSAGGCGGGQGGACAQPVASSGGCGGGRGVCSEPGCGRGRAVCAEPGCGRSSRGLQTSGGAGCAGSSGGCGGGRGVCSEPGCGRGRGVCFEPGCGGGRGVCSEPGCRS